MISFEKIFSQLAPGEDFLTPAPRVGLAGLKTRPNGRFGPGPKGVPKGVQNGAKNGAKMESEKEQKLGLFGAPKQ